MRVLVLGATSGIAQATSRLLAEEGASLFLVGRSSDRLGAVRDDLHVRGAAAAEIATADLDLVDRHEAVVAEAEERLGPFDLVLLAQGALGDPERYRQDGAAAATVLHANLVGPASLLTIVARRMEERRAGCIVALSSVAGDRGRARNYVYGAAKAGLSAMLQGLRMRLARVGVRVVTVKPGWVDTAMTDGLRKNALVARPDRVARDIVRAVRLGRDVVYTPWWWRWIQLAVRAIPERFWKRMAL